LKVVFTDDGWDDYRHWGDNDVKLLRRINVLIERIRRDPFRGVGKPEQLKGQLSGFWSRRITREHRLVYGVEGKDEDQQVVIIQCRYHY